MWKGYLKTILLVTLVCALTAGAAFGQRKLNFRSVEFGLGPAMVSLHDNDPLVNNSPKPSFSASGGLIYSLKRNLYITTHAMYELKGGKSVQNFPNGEGTPIRYNTTSSYVTFAPGVRRYLFDGDVFLEGGPFVSFLLNSTSSRNPNSYRPATIDTGASFSIGYTPYRPQYNGLNFRLVNNVGLNDMNLRTGTKEWTNSLAFIVGYRIRMN
jgi:hypothetical protein